MIVVPQPMLDLIKTSEGLRLTKYTDLSGNITIGYGHKVLPTDNIPDTITQEQADILLQQDATIALLAVRQLTTVALNINQISALGDFVFNLGKGSYQRSTLRMVINRSEFQDAPAQFGRWVYAGTRQEPGLITRRTLEAKLFASAN